MLVLLVWFVAVLVVFGLCSAGTIDVCQGF